MQETCQALDHERRQHRELRRTWQRANDQLIESQAHAVSHLLILKLRLELTELDEIHLNLGGGQRSNTRETDSSR